MFFVSDPGSSQDLISIANTFLNDRDFIEAKSAIDEAFEKAEFLENPRAWYTKGRVYHEILKSKNPDLSKYKSDMNAFVGEIIEAYTKTKTLTNSGSNLSILANNQIQLLWMEGINQGVTYFQTQDYDKAYDSFTTAKVARPADTTAYIYSGMSAQGAKKYDLALENFNAVKALAPLSKNVHRGIIGSTQSNGSTLQEQLDVIEQGLLDFPDYIPFVIHEVKTLVNMGKFTEAESRLQTVLNRNPDSHDIKIRQADLFDRIFKQAFIEGRPDRSDRYFNLASAKYEEYIAVFPNSFEAHYNYGAMINEKANRFYVQGNLMTKEEFEISGEEIQEKGHLLTRKALPYMERARLLKPEDPATINALRVFYKRLKMDEKLASLNNW